MSDPEMPKGEFVSGYCERSSITEEEFYLHGDAVPCDCGESCCDGWAYLSHEKIARDKKHQSKNVRDSKIIFKR
ncbi:TPA: hypothetical protein LAM16_003469 [Escherichia coli]|uniref:hypothetical protein n=1 Tax=Escherichia coli TaxID=562 RepID=UPI001B20C7D7|nr:hypothetical protein [Escherichia coli]UND83590.1 hypothetical protein H9194_06890 [Escherichia coli]HAZ7210021.1 hypothetical protein [Escherichia coli]HBJ0167585.1 hypothetical protein [Escherichia coli]HBJ0181579.1 hypothetical protein [Escherichia coli]HBJ0414203.1 hypothetical protein [Escherichia coli]